MVNTPTWRSSFPKIIFSMLKSNYYCYLWIFRIYKKNEKLVKHITTSWLICQITVIYLHSWTEKLVLVVETWLISDFPGSRLKFGYKKVNPDLICQINNNKMFSLIQPLELFMLSPSPGGLLFIPLLSILEAADSNFTSKPRQTCPFNSVQTGWREDLQEQQESSSFQF